MTYSFSSEGSERELTPEEIADITRRYWHTDELRKDIEASVGLTTNAFGKQLPPLESGVECPHCSSPMVWRSQLGRRKDDQYCTSCDHRSGWCQCSPCRALMQASEARRAAEEAQRRRSAQESWLGEYGSVEYVEWAVGTLSQRQRIFLHALRDHWSQEMTIEQIAVDAGLQARRAPVYWNAVAVVQLIFHDGAKWQIHPRLTGMRVLGPTPRRTSSGHRIQAVPTPASTRPPASSTASATEKQRSYIESLLKRQGLSLRDLYPVTEFAQLTRRDAQFLIDGLKDPRPMDLRHWEQPWTIYFEREQTRDEAMWPVLCLLIPDLERLRNEIRLDGEATNFCDREAWYGHPNQPDGIRDQLSQLLGPEVRTIRSGFREPAFEVAHRSLARALPQCRCHTDHTRRLADTLQDMTA